MEHYTSYGNISLESETELNLKLLHVEQLNTIHQKLKIIKPVIYYFKTDEEVRQINKQSLEHDYYTDVITFDYEDDPDIEENEVVVSYERITDNAKQFNTLPSNETMRVLIHALLHLAGFKDSNEPEQQEMRRQEEHYLTLYCST